MQNLVSHKKPKDCSYDELILALQTHYKPNTNVVYERFKFYNRSQGTNESIAEFAGGLKACAHSCNFGETLKEMLRDRLICGMKNEATQRALLAEENLTYERAIEVATARQAAARNVQAMTHPQQGIQFVKHQSQQQPSKPNTKTGNNKPSKPCSGCGGSHWRNDCPFKNAKFFNCDRKGHLSKFCFSKSKSDSSNVKPNFPNKFKNKPKPTNYVSHASAGNNYCESSGSSNAYI